ncbi:hypothetical protein FV222_00165 [Methylobacterium sp. WL103]|uniref:hypothetical protein n=1 Tax=Methylobacterium sp. WL103 TaxID=2603891 RepID=UPI0011D5C5DA|nr:hypothetical protein [Methylobacterium sp. WL103]TXN08920.1 hypothetical protein FV222_00165 [Methylobacterium sp. WL103]
MTMRAISIVAVCLLTMPAQADWQYTRFGMTVGEVVAASGGVAKTNTDRSRDGREFESLLVAPYTGNGFTFTSVFRFDRKTKRLITVELELENTSRCSNLEKNLYQSYHEPIETDKGIGVVTVTWHDASKKNIVSLTALPPSFCTVRYDPILVTEPSGGL